MKKIIVTISLLFCGMVFSQTQQQKIERIIELKEIVDFYKNSYPLESLEARKDNMKAEDLMNYEKLKVQLSNQYLSKLFVENLLQSVSEADINEVYKAYESGLIDKLIKIQQTKAKVNSKLDKEIDLYATLLQRYQNINNTVTEAPVVPQSPVVASTPVKMEVAKTNQPTPQQPAIASTPVKKEEVKANYPNGFYLAKAYDINYNLESFVLEDEPVLNISEVKSIIVEKNKYSIDNKPVIMVDFSKKGIDRLYDITKNNLNKPLAIVLGNKLISAPIIHSEIKGGRLIISGDLTFEEAEKIKTAFIKEKNNS